jgi:alpha 1,2-mannosyltransferase
LSFSHEGYGQATSLSKIKEQLVGTKHQPPYKTPVPGDYYTHPNTSSPHAERKANAAIVMLARNGDLPGIVKSMKQMEDRFNKKFHYPYVFLNEEPFTDKFKQYAPCHIKYYSDLTHFCRRTSELTDSKTQYGLIPHDNWYQPDWIDEKKATEARDAMVKNQVIYGGMLRVSSKQMISLRFVPTQVVYRTFDFSCFELHES